MDDSHVRLASYLSSPKMFTLFSSVTASNKDGLSKYLDEVFDTAYNETQIAGDLPHVRWGRIDYLNVTAITTKWVVWQYVLLTTTSEPMLRRRLEHHS